MLYNNACPCPACQSDQMGKISLKLIILLRSTNLATQGKGTTPSLSKKSKSADVLILVAGGQ